MPHLLNGAMVVTLLFYDPTFLLNDSIVFEYQKLLELVIYFLYNLRLNMSLLCTYTLLNFNFCISKLYSLQLRYTYNSVGDLKIIWFRTSFETR